VGLLSFCIVHWKDIMAKSQSKEMDNDYLHKVFNMDESIVPAVFDMIINKPGIFVYKEY